MPEAYPNWKAISQAMKAGAQREYAAGTSKQDVSTRLLQAQHDRFLCRVFAEGDRSEWLLKGGSAMLARVADSRRTQDIDLSAPSRTDLDSAQAELERLVGRDLGDHLKFVLGKSRSNGAGARENQPGLLLRRLTFDTYEIGGTKKGEIPVDLVVGVPPVGRIETVEPASRLNLARPLPSSPYRLFPISDQIADKVAATLSVYPGGRESSRVKDLVDLVLIANTQRVELAELRLAIHSKLHTLNMAGREFSVPESWAHRYPIVARPLDALAGRTDLPQAMAIVAEFLGPAMSAESVDTSLTWVPGTGWRSIGTGSARSDDAVDRARVAYPDPASTGAARPSDPTPPLPPSGRTPGRER